MQKNDKLLYLAILAIFAGSNCFGAIDGALSKIAEAMNVSPTTALYVCSIATLASTFSSLLFGTIAGTRLPYKTAVVLCSSLMLFGGTAPFFTEGFALLLFTRFVFGIGIGGIMSLQNPIATKLLPADKRASIIGVGTCVSFAFQCVMQLVGGVLADYQWHYVFLTYLILLLPLVCLILFLPKMELRTATLKQEKRGRLPLPALGLSAVMGVVGLNLAPLLFGSAFYVAPINDSATVASIIAMLFSVGCMAGGLSFSMLYKKLQEKSLSVFLLIGAVGLGISAVADNIVLLGLGFAVGGVCLACSQACIMLALGNICDLTQLGLASALMIAFMNLGCFCCSEWEAFIGSITGDALYMPLWVGVGMFTVTALILLFTFPKSKAAKSS